MASFIQKKLPSAKSLPEALKEERLKRQLSPEQLSFKTNISIKYLEALEKGRYHLLPGEIYALQFIKKLAKIYNFNEKNLLGIYEKEKKSQPALINFNQHPHQTIKTEHWLSPKKARYFLIILIIAAFGGYFGWEIKNIFTPPNLEIFSPLSQTITAEAAVKITGKTDPESTVQINQQEILIDPLGNFSQTVDLTIGLNVFKISAGKKHSRLKEITIAILREAAAAANLNLNTRENNTGSLIIIN